jgi:hypothetical protein
MMNMWNTKTFEEMQHCTVFILTGSTLAAVSIFTDHVMYSVPFHQLSCPNMIFLKEVLQ